MALIEEIAGLVVQAAALEAENRQFANSSGRRRGRPKDVMIPFLAPKLLAVFSRCHDRAGRQSVATSVDGKITQKEAGELFLFIDTIIQPLNQYLTTELHRRSLSAERLARYALDDRRRMTQALKQREAKASAKKAAVARSGNSRHSCEPSREFSPYVIDSREFSPYRNNFHHSAM